MVREIEFRAKDIRGNWAYGSLIIGNNYDFIITGEDYDNVVASMDTLVCQCHPIDKKSNSIGQYTGLKDKNGTKIFEGDVVELYCIRTYCGRQISKYDIPTKCRVVVKFTKCWNGYGVGFMFDYNNKFNENVCQPIGNEQNERDLWKRAIGEFVYNEYHKKQDHPKWIWKDHIEVIGNVIDNPELLGE